MATNTNLSWVELDDPLIQFTLIDVGFNGASLPRSLVGDTVIMHIKPNKEIAFDDPSVVTYTSDDNIFIVGSPTDGVVQVQIEGADLALQKQWFYNLLVLDQDGRQITYNYGRLELTDV